MADQIRATPQNATLGAIANFLKQTYAPQRTQQMQGVMELLGVPALARTAERMSYGEPVTNINKANVPLLPADTAEAAMLAGPPLASLARRVGTNLVQTAPYVARDLAQSMTSPMRSYVVKPKGGNWLAGSVERSIEPMKTRVVGSDPAARLRDLDAAYAQNVEAGVAMDPAVFARERARLEPEAAMNRWLENKLGKYFSKEMATPEDPLRALAERGVLHYDPTPTGYSVSKQRIAAGFPEEGMAQSDLAKRWEKRADTFFNELQASDLTRGYPELVEKDPWLAKVPPETRVYELLGGANEELGMQHLVDELKNAINPTSGLPENLRLKYQDLEKVTVPQAVERVAKINEWRAAQKAEADLARAMGPATHLVKEYPEQGFKWVELRKPETTGKNVARTKSAEELEMAGEGVETMSHDDIVSMTRDMARDEGIRPGTQEFNDMLQENIRMFGVKPSEIDESVKSLEDALKYEGETMGHCVGGYCPDVVEGRSKIFSLRDKKGQPHVTIEVRPGEGSVYQYLASKNLDLEKEAQKLYPKSSKIASQDLLISDIEATPEYAEWVRSLPQEIVQIKGSGKKDPGQKIRHAGTGYKDNPDAHLLPMVHDFVRSQNWSNVGDLKNAGLVQLPDKRLITNEQFDEAIGRISDGGDRPTNEWFMNVMRGDPSWWDEMKGAFEGFSHGGQVRGYAAGGLVGSNIYNSDAMQDPASAYRFADGGQAGDVRAYADGGLVANSHTADFDPARIDAIVGDLNALNAG